jgi:hypothetical protein
MIRQNDVLEHQMLQQLFPLLAGDAFQLNDPLIRNCGTFAGALARADPASDWTAIALALDAEVHIRSAEGDRAVPIELRDRTQEQRTHDACHDSGSRAAIRNGLSEAAPPGFRICARRRGRRNRRLAGWGLHTVPCGRHRRRPARVSR